MFRLAFSKRKKVLNFSSRNKEKFMRSRVYGRFAVPQVWQERRIAR